jgi:hypothetical protein
MGPISLYSLLPSASGALFGLAAAQGIALLMPRTGITVGEAFRLLAVAVLVAYGVTLH